jgi:hypothetical protein
VVLVKEGPFDCRSLSCSALHALAGQPNANASAFATSQDAAALSV